MDKEASEMPPAATQRLRLLRNVGELVHGKAWQKPMSKDMAVANRTVGRWVKGKHPVPETLPDGTPFIECLMKILRKHQREVQDMIRVLERVEATVG